MSSLTWMYWSDVVCQWGMVLCAISAFFNWRAWKTGKTQGGNVVSRLAFLSLLVAVGLMGQAMWARYLEVNHFPSQTMAEVLSMSTLAGLLSMTVLHWVLKLQKRGAGWAILDDALIALVMGLTLLVHWWIAGLSTAQRDLPPALQSYWFPPHLSALIFSYLTLVIAALICLVWFTMRFWTGLLQGGFSLKSQILVLLVLVLVPFLQVPGIIMLTLGGVIFGALKLTGNMPTAESVKKLERDFGDVSHLAFSVGIPFLTAGLFMGAFWAQEAWANYWGWDSKENSALITWLVYVIYFHVRMLGGYRGEKAMAWLIGGAFSIFITFQLFGYLPDSQKSLHRYTDDNVVPKEGMQGPAPSQESSSRQRTDEETKSERVARAGDD